MDFSNLRRQSQIAALDEAQIADENASVFVAGPYIDISRPAEDVVNSSSTGKALRYALCRSFFDLGVDVYMGENDFLRKNGAKNFGSLNNAVVYERHHIVKHIDALIVLPCSPGSFCEFGDWATTKSTCKISLVLVDQQHEGKNNYINDGVIVFSKNNGAEISYIDYENHEIAFRLAAGFLKKIKSDQRIDGLYAR